MYPYQVLQPHVDAIKHWFTTADRLEQIEDDRKVDQRHAADELEQIDLSTPEDIEEARITLDAYRAARSAYVTALLARHDHSQTQPPEPLTNADGGYPIVYYTQDGEEICPACSHSVADELAGADIFYEGATVYCAECSRPIESAYGDPDEEENAGPPYPETPAEYRAAIEAEQTAYKEDTRDHPSEEDDNEADATYHLQWYRPL